MNEVVANRAIQLADGPVGAKMKTPIHPNDHPNAYVNESLMLVTALSPVIGYDKAAAIAHRANDEGTSLRAAAIASGAISAEEFDKIVVPARMVGFPRTDLRLI